MSLIGLLTATEKQVYMGRLHMRPIQWHLKNHWRIPISLEKVILIQRSLHPHIKWCPRDRCPVRSATTPTEPCCSDLYRYLKRWLGRSLRRSHRKWDLATARKQVAYKLCGTKSSLLGPKRVPGPVQTKFFSYQQTTP